MVLNSTYLKKTKTFFLCSLLLTSFISSFGQTDVTRPTIISVSPAGWSISINAGTTVSATFSEAMNPATINNSTFELRNAFTNVLVNATIVYNAASRTATLYPTSPLNSLLYVAKVKGGTAGVKDLAGNAMLSDYSWYFIIIPLVDLTPPVVLSVSPSNGATGVSVSTSVTAVMSEEMLTSSINASTVELRNAANVLIPATVTYIASTRTIKLTPATALSASTVYKAIIKGGSTGVKDGSGNPLAVNYSWTFTTAAPADNTPPTIISVTPANGTVGVTVNSVVTALFSEPMNGSTINTSTFELRNASSVLVNATVTYNEATKTATLTPSANLSSSIVYTATVKGGAAGIKDVSGIPLAANYSWTFTTAAPADNTPPTIVSVTPLNGSTGVSVSTTATALFSETMNSSTINTSTVELRNSQNNLVSATVTYNEATKTVTVTPAANLSNSTLYTVTIKGGASGVKDITGNALANNYTWSFTTGASVFDPNLLPVYPSFSDQPVEVGMRFRSNTNGQITALRFYKGVGNIGTHIGHLWTNTGQLLAEVTFTQETASGWQQVMLANPVSINAGVTYVVSYYSTAGIYAYTNNFFTQPLTNGPLTALADGQDGSNGVFQYSPVSVFPTNSYLSTNYFVDVVFGTGPDNSPPVVLSTLPSNGAIGVNINSPVSASFSEVLNSSTVNTSTFELRNSSGTLIPGAVSFDAASMKATLTPSSPLSYYADYTAKIKGGSSGVKDAAGNAMVNDYTWTFRAGDPPLLAPTEGPGGPILVISTTTNPFSRYAVEILRAEGLNEFAAADISAVTATMLNNYDVIVLGEMTVTADQVLMLTNWVTAGGTLIAFKPSALLAPLMGILPATGTLSDKYLLVNTASGPGNGLVNQTIQYHGTANLHLSNGAISLATLYSDASTSTIYPAVTTMNVGLSGGRAVAFTYDLARSIVYTRQGNPAWAGQKRDGQSDPIRADDLFYPSWIDFNKIAIPQADEQQRLLANIILQGNLHRKPLPRFWYLPRDLKAAVVMTGDDHNNGGTVGRFNQYLGMGPNTAQDVNDWKAIRGTSYIYPNTPMSNAQVMSFESQGFEVALHPHTNCLNYTPATLLDDFAIQLGQFAANYPGVSSPVTNRTHCLVWSDWASEPKTELQKGMRLDVTYYYWPEVWMQNRPGMFTGSGMPMRFADMNGSLIDVYQAPTQMTDETNMNYTSFCNTVLDKAIGPEGYYGVFTANMHTDFNPSSGSDAIIASALARQVPVISAKQMLTWLDGRNNSSFSNMTWNNNQLTFTVTARTAANNLKAMLPINLENGAKLITITRNGTSVLFTTQLIKGMQYGFFAPAPGINMYVATYAASNLRMADTLITKTDMVEQSDPVVTNDQQKQVQPATGVQPLLPKLYVNALPNPSQNSFNIVISSSNANPVTVRVVDMFGRLIEQHERVTSTGILRLGASWTGGTYLAEVIQGNEKKVIKLLKTN